MVTRRRVKRRRTLADAMLAVGLLMLGLFIGAAGGLLWVAQGGLPGGPTATPTATPREPFTPTPDFRATRVAEDLATQVAYNSALATRRALNPPGTPTETSGATKFLPVAAQPDATAIFLAEQAASEATAQALALEAQNLIPAEQQPSPLETPTPVTVGLPLVDTASVPTATVTLEPAPIGETTPEQADIPTDLPVTITATVALTIPPTPEPTSTPTPTVEPPTPTATPFASPTPTIVFTLNSMRGIIDRQNAVARVGPGSFYTQSDTIAVGTQITLLARDVTGEWVYLCCAPSTNAPVWVRSNTTRPIDNPALPTPLGTRSPDDIRWLVVRGPDANQTPVPTVPPVLPNEFPMFRNDRYNSGRVPQLPRPPLNPAWGGQAGLAGQPYSSGVVVGGNAVYAASADGHIYAFNRESGSQLWRFNLGEMVRAAPLVDGARVYVATENGRLVALENQGLAATQRWSVALDGMPRGGILPGPGQLILTLGTPGGERLVVVNRESGSVVHSIALGGMPAQAPALANQTIYVASDAVRAYDIWTGELVWQTNESTQYTTPPLYTSPGVEAASELYVADSQGRLVALDANNGTLLWAAPVGGSGTGIAANNTTVFVSGPGFVRAFARAQRSEGQLLWSATIAGTIPGGPLVDDNIVLIVSDGGNVQYIDAITGALISANIQAPPVAGSPAVADGYLFTSGTNAFLFAARQGP